MCSGIDEFHLFDFDVKTHPPEKFLSILYEDQKVFANLETILRYIFATADKTWVVEEVLGNSDVITRIAQFYSSGIPLKTVQPRGDGSGDQSSCTSPAISMQIRKYTINGLVLANYIKGRHEDSEFGHCSDTDIVTRASQMCQAMQDFLTGLCEQDRSGLFYNPARDPRLRSAWRKIVVYIDSFLTWINTGRPVGQALLKSTLHCISRVTGGLESGQADNQHLVPPSTISRLQCCGILCKSIIGGRLERNGTTDDLKLNYPARSTFHPSHPCDLFLKSLMGDPGDVLEPIAISIHEKLSKACDGYKAMEVDKLTNYITQRRYRDKGKRFFGGISCTSWESVLHVLLHQGPENGMSGSKISPTVSSGYDSLKSFFVPFVRSLPQCAWFPGMCPAHDC